MPENHAPLGIYLHIPYCPANADIAISFPARAAGSCRRTTATPLCGNFARTIAGRIRYTSAEEPRHCSPLPRRHS